MGQILLGSATTTKTIRRAIQDSQASLGVLSRRHGINPKTVAKSTKRGSADDLPTGPREPKSTVLSVEEEAIVVAFRRHTSLPLDECLYALQATISSTEKPTSVVCHVTRCRELLLSGNDAAAVLDPGEEARSCGFVSVK